MDEALLRDIVQRALIEDDAEHDVTTLATVPADAYGRARLVARESCVVAGTAVFAACFRALDPGVKTTVRFDDGASVEPADTIAGVEGPLRAILSAERAALNFIQRLSGIATLTRAFVDAAAGTPVLDTRKTTPGLRALEKDAVRAGGGTNHRASLAEAVLIKDNHIAAAGGVAAAVRAVRASLPGGFEIEVECDTLDQVHEAVEAGAERLLLDNMDLETLARAVGAAEGRARTEASGGVTLETIREIAATGVDEISVGALTHSARAVDLSLELEVP